MVEARKKKCIDIVEECNTDSAVVEIGIYHFFRSGEREGL